MDNYYSDEIQINDSETFLKVYTRRRLDKTLGSFCNTITLSEENVVEWVIEKLRKMFDKVKFGFNYFQNVTNEGFEFDERVLTSAFRNPSPQTIELIQNCLFSHRIMPRKVGKRKREIKTLWRITSKSLAPFTQLFSEFVVKYTMACLAAEKCAFKRCAELTSGKKVQGIWESFTRNELYRGEIIKLVKNAAECNHQIEYVIGKKCVIATCNPDCYGMLGEIAREIDHKLYIEMEREIEKFYNQIDIGARAKEKYQKSFYYSLYITDGTYEWAKEYLETDGFEVSYAPIEEECKYMQGFEIGFRSNDGIKIYLKY